MSEKVSLPSLIASIAIFVAFLAFQFWLMVHSIHESKCGEGLSLKSGSLRMARLIAGQDAWFALMGSPLHNVLRGNVPCHRTLRRNNSGANKRPPSEVEQFYLPPASRYCV